MQCVEHAVRWALALVLLAAATVAHSSNNAKTVLGPALVDLGARRPTLSLAVETDEAFNPIDARLLGADAVVPKADPIAHLVEEARRRRRF